MAPKVTVHGSGGGKDAETPSQQVIKAAADTAFAMDAKGRKITVKSLTFLEQYRLSKILGENAKNETTMGMAMATASVRDIDGDPVSFPAKESELEFTMQRLDSVGFTAAFEAMKELNQAEGSDQAKN